jgi:hypothetical protein
MRKTRKARMKLKNRGREGWMFLNPTMGTYQRRKMRQRRITQVRTSSPTKILFLGFISNGILSSIQISNLEIPYKSHPNFNKFQGLEPQKFSLFVISGCSIKEMRKGSGVFLLSLWGRG